MILSVGSHLKFLWNLRLVTSIYFFIIYNLFYQYLLLYWCMPMNTRKYCSHQGMFFFVLRLSFIYDWIKIFLFPFFPSLYLSSFTLHLLVSILAIALMFIFLLTFVSWIYLQHFVVLLQFFATVICKVQYPKAWLYQLFPSYSQTNI